MNLPLSVSLQNALCRLFRFFSEEIPECERIHPEFKYCNHDNGFHYNVAGTGPINDTHSLQIFLNKNELTKLDHSPFIGKIAPNENPDFFYDYCAFFYVNSDQKFSNLKKWAREANFRFIIEHHRPPQGFESYQPK